MGNWLWKLELSSVGFGGLRVRAGEKADWFFLRVNKAGGGDFGGGNGRLDVCDD